ncbi:MAG: HD domain-containing protein, partial [Promethearchaeota archaeon]
MLEDELFSVIKEYAIDNSVRDDIHGFNHVERVYDLAITIGENLNAEIDLLKIAVLLHDIGRIDEKRDHLKRNHAELSAEKAFKFLTS